MSTCVDDVIENIWRQLRTADVHFAEALIHGHEVMHMLPNVVGCRAAENTRMLSKARRKEIH